MPLVSGSRLGPYEVIEPLGAGGMGEVYRARDTRLDRTVAIKVLGQALAGDPAGRERFRREAHVISSLSHPHICTLHDVGMEADIDFLVMEFVDGVSLADRLREGPLSLGEALRISREIALALAAAHARGIVHRDLKPENVMLTKGGTKLLDFGVASVRSGGDTATITRLTGAHAVVGTIPYMAPEQLQGRDVDGRADLFALGAMMFEVLTGRRAFEGKDDASVISAVLKDHPPAVTALRPDAPAAVDRLVAACLAKEPDARWHCATDLVRELDWIVAAEPAVARQTNPRSHVRPAAAGFVAGIALASAALFLLSAWPETTPAGSVFFEVPPPSYGSFVPTSGPPGVAQLAVAPDGRKIAAVIALGDGRQVIAVRDLGRETMMIVRGAEGALFPFWSPDSRSLGFFADGKLKVLRTLESLPEVLCAAVAPHGGTWGPGGILFSAIQEDDRIGLHLVPPGGGTPKSIARPPSVSTRLAWPAFVPGERRYLVLQVELGARPGPGDVLIGQLDGEAPRRLMSSSSQAISTSSDALLFVRDGVLLRQAFDPDRARLVGEAQRLAEGVGGAAPIGYAAFAAAANVVAHAPSPFDSDRALIWWTRAGLKEEALGAAGDVLTPRLSPDDRTLALARSQGTGARNIWLLDLARNATTRLTLESAMDSSPVWSPDGGRVAYSSMRAGIDDLWLQAVSSSADPVLRVRSPAIPTDWTPDGLVLYNGFGHPTRTSWAGSDIFAVAPDDGTDPIPIIASHFNEAQARLSPDGRYIAYMSDESGTLEVYVQPFPADGRKWSVSVGGGQEPSWRSDGSELFYLAPDGTMTAVAVRLKPDFEAGSPVALFKLDVIPLTLPYRTRYTVTRDGQRFLAVVLAPDTRSPHISILVSGASVP